MHRYENLARELGFTEAVFLDGLALECKAELRSYCNPEQCANYEKNWVCPPGCGTLDECQAKLRQHHRGLLVQSVTDLVPPTPKKMYEELAAAHGDRLRKLASALKKEETSMLILSYGGCNLCGQCSYPAPCVRPNEKMESLGAYGIDVGALCAGAGLSYSFCEERLYMTALVLL